MPLGKETRPAYFPPKTMSSAVEWILFTKNVRLANASPSAFVSIVAENVFTRPSHAHDRQKNYNEAHRINPSRRFADSPGNHSIGTYHGSLVAARSVDAAFDLRMKKPCFPGAGTSITPFVATPHPLSPPPPTFSTSSEAFV